MLDLKNSTVMIVDDTQTNIDILVGALEQDYELIVAIDGVTALDLLEVTKPDLILLDIMMPKLSGFDVARIIRENKNLSNVPIIFITALNDIESKTKGFKMGAVDYITKPFEIEEVRIRVKTHLELKIAKDQLAYQNRNLEYLVAERTMQNEELKNATIYCMAAVAETRDPETGHHIHRTQHYVKLLLEEYLKENQAGVLNVNKFVDACFNASPLHDIGKVAIPDSILLKPGKLTDEEFELMKMHTIFGKDLLEIAKERVKSNAFIDMGIEFALTHHEKWNGEGYPNGLKAEEIPLTGRVMAIADVYDALVSKRVYKGPMSHEEAVSIIKSGAGSHFDPYLVELFLRLSEKFKQVYLDNRD